MVRIWRATELNQISQDAVDYLTWTYFFRRLLRNPSYYGLEEADFAAMNANLSQRVDATLRDLEASHCLEIDEDDGVTVYPLTFGRIASFYYLSHRSMAVFYDEIDETSELESLLEILCATAEYDELPVRHNEDKLNAELARLPGIRWRVDERLMDDPHTKASLLLQAHFSDLVLPISDYITDTKSVLDQSVRVLQAMVDVSADGGWLFTALRAMQLCQMVMQGRWLSDSSLLTLPHINHRIVSALHRHQSIDHLPQLIEMGRNAARATLARYLSGRRLSEACRVLLSLPEVDIEVVEKLPDLDAQAEGKLEVNLQIRNYRTLTSLAHTPRYPKRKQLSWWLVLGLPESGELLALRRVSVSRGQRRLHTSLSFEPLEQPGEYQMWLYLMADCYIGLDQQRPIRLTVTGEASPHSDSDETSEDEAAGG